MQKAGYVFFELYVIDLAHYVAIFRDALGFQVVENDPDFAKLVSTQGTVLLNATTELPPSHPFAEYRRHSPRGLGVELGVVVEALDQARERAQQIAGCSVSDVTVQEWGMRDFRIQTKEGYYFRITTPDEG